MKKLLRIVVPILLAALIVASIGWYLFVFDRNFTRDMLLRQARFNDMNGNTGVSAWFYNMAYVYSGNDANVAIELAEQYKSDGNFTKAEVTLSRAIHAGATAELYTALCRTYVEQDKLMDAVALLAGIPDEAIRQTLEAQRPTAPEPSHTPGFYNQYIDLTLTSSSGTLLYTTNGEYPSIKNEPYSEPIHLNAGETVVYCISVDEQGLVSPLSIMGYTVGGVIEPAVFANPAMEAAIREQLVLREDEVIYTNMLWEITEFALPSDVNDLEDLALMPYLQSLVINGRQLDSLEELSSLSKLTSLDLSGCRFPASELAVVAKLPSLTKLVLANCNLSTIADLAEAEGLVYLDISDNTVRNLDVISGMSGMRELYLQHNALTGLEALAVLSRLETLDISYNSVSSLAPLSSCVSLTWLNAESNLIEAIEGVDDLPALTSLSLSYNSLTDISPLGSCLQLEELSLKQNSIEDLSALATLVHLEIFDFSYNSVKVLPEWPKDCALRVIDGAYNAVESLDALSGMPNLTYISMDYNKITNVDSLAKCGNLVQVNVYGNEIDSVTALTEHNIIVNYDPTK